MLFEVVAATGVEVNAFLDVMPCSLVHGPSWCLHYQEDAGFTFLNLLVTI
jgi:hypothetical protein